MNFHQSDHMQGCVFEGNYCLFILFTALIARVLVLVLVVCYSEGLRKRYKTGCQTACSKKLAAVCGSDGITYGKFLLV